MMKQTRNILINALLSMLLLSGCGAQQAAEAPEETAEPEQITETAQADETAGEEEKILVMYFSRTGEQYNVGNIEKGNTSIVADMIVEATGADAFEIIPEDDHYPYTYDELTEVAKKEQAEHTAVPYAGELPDLDEYQKIFIGSPVWWGDWPMIMYTLFETADFSGRTLIPFNTNEGSGMAGFEDKLKNACPDAQVLSGLAIRGNDAQNNPDTARAAVNEWLNGLGFGK